MNFDVARLLRELQQSKTSYFSLLGPDLLFRMFINYFDLSAWAALLREHTIYDYSFDPSLKMDMDFICLKSGDIILYDMSMPMTSILLKEIDGRYYSSPYWNVYQIAADYVGMEINDCNLIEYPTKGLFIQVSFIDSVSDVLLHVVDGKVLQRIDLDLEYVNDFYVYDGHLYMLGCDVQRYEDEEVTNVRMKSIRSNGEVYDHFTVDVHSDNIELFAVFENSILVIDCIDEHTDAWRYLDRRGKPLHTILRPVRTQYFYEGHNIYYVQVIKSVIQIYNAADEFVYTMMTDAFAKMFDCVGGRIVVVGDRGTEFKVMLIE